MVVHRVSGEDYGRLAIRHIDGTRTLLDRTCMRVHIATDHGVCLAENEGVVASFTTTFFRAENLNADIKSYASALPSRARISPGGTFSAVTAFVSGSSYADIGAETTTIVTIDEIDSNQLLRGANQFTIASNEARLTTRTRSSDDLKPRLLQLQRSRPLYKSLSNERPTSAPKNASTGGRPTVPGTTGTITPRWLVRLDLNVSFGRRCWCLSARLDYESCRRRCSPRVRNPKPSRAKANVAATVLVVPVNASSGASDSGRTSDSGAAAAVSVPAVGFGNTHAPTSALAGAFTISGYGNLGAQRETLNSQSPISLDDS
jgi:hypothetical protein